MSGKLLGIAVRPGSGEPLGLLEQTTIRTESGVDGDYRRRTGARQVTVLVREDWEVACDAAGATLPWTTRRANLLVEGVTLAEKIGTQFRVGGTLLEITGETRPCQMMEAAQAGLQEALGQNWRGGVTCRVIETGVVTIGDRIEFAASLPAK